ncbi:excalibur calcium-binding domain-containing protein [Gymnodinialimonas sp.]
MLTVRNSLCAALCALALCLPASAEQEAVSVLPRVQDTAFGQLTHAQSFTCSGRTCTQMSSCAEACHALLVCGDRRRDGDNDGIPCENLCRSRC